MPDAEFNADPSTKVGISRRVNLMVHHAMIAKVNMASVQCGLIRGPVIDKFNPAAKSLYEDCISDT